MPVDPPQEDLALFVCAESGGFGLHRGKGIRLSGPIPPASVYRLEKSNESESTLRVGGPVPPGQCQFHRFIVGVKRQRPSGCQEEVTGGARRVGAEIEV